MMAEVAGTTRGSADADSPATDVFARDGDRLGTVQLPPTWFAGDINRSAVHQVMTAQLANARRPIAGTKTRGGRRGGGRKPWRQKGTGRARHGSIRSPLWKGGGVAHGPRGNETHGKRVNKRTKRLALRSVLTDRAQAGAVIVVRDLFLDEPRTKDAVAALEALGCGDGRQGRRVLVVLGDNHQPTVRSFRNLPDVHPLVVDQLNTYDVLVSDVVVVDEAALELIGTGRRTGYASRGEQDDDNEAAQ